MSDELIACHDRHFTWCLTLVHGAEAGLIGPDQRLWLQRLAREHDNLREALAWSRRTAGRQAEGLRLATGPYVTIAHVRGTANAGGVGFVAASDIVLADETAQFSLSELLFGLYPACVMPFLIRRIGFQKANYFTMMTKPISAMLACEWGLVDAVEPVSEVLLRRHLQRLRRLSKTAIRRYKTYMSRISGPFGKQTCHCKNVKGGDPDPSKFLIPPGYKKV